MKRTSRRSLFGLAPKAKAMSQAPGDPTRENAERGEVVSARPSQTTSEDARREARPPACQGSSEAGGRTQFSLDEFYRARGPQKLPPIVIRPEVLMHRVPTTAVGSPPPHDAPAVEEQPLYRALCEEQPHDKERSS